MLQPVAPWRRLRQLVEPLDHRQGEPFQVSEQLNLPIEVQALRFVFGRFFAAQAHLLLQAREASLPPIAATHDCGIDNQLLPLRGSRRSSACRCLFGVLLGKLLANACAPHAELFNIWSLAEREILGEPRRRVAFACAREQRKKRATSGIWPHAAVSEIERNASAIESL